MIEIRERQRRARRSLALVPRFFARVGREERQRFDAVLRGMIATTGSDLLLVSGPEVYPWLRGRFPIPAILDAYDLMWVLLARKNRLDLGVSERLRTKLRVWIENRLALRFEKEVFKLFDAIYHDC